MWGCSVRLAALLRVLMSAGFGRAGRGVRGGSGPGLVSRIALYETALARLIALLNQGGKAEIYALLSPGFRANCRFQRFGQIADEIIRRRGRLLEQGTPFFTGEEARIRVTAERGEWLVRLCLDAAGRIDEFWFEDKPALIVPTRNLVHMHLPFHDEWSVISGGPDPANNHHAAADLACQARAIDFGLADASGKLFRNAGTRNEDYHAFNRPVLVPADGTVRVVIDGVPDNEPGKINPFASAGNTVIIQHAASEFSALLHLRPGSLGVKVGERVGAGQTVGLCGNSGNSSGPHIHFHLMNSEVPIDATGFSPFFERVWLRREGDPEATLEEDYSPIAGDRLREAPSAGEPPSVARESFFPTA